MNTSYSSFFAKHLTGIFFCVFIFKVLASILAFSLVSPWILGFFLPLGVMIAYIVVGWFSVKNNTRELRTIFGDSCYYLGFLFTLSTIVIALFDVGLRGVEIQAIATRFAAAMVSTLIGLAVRIAINLYNKHSHNIIGDYSSTNNGKQGDAKSDPNHPENNLPYYGDEDDSFADKALEVSPDDDISIIIQANCRNLALLNNLLNVSLHQFEELSNQMQYQMSRQITDIDANTQFLKEAHKQLFEESETRIKNSLSALESSVKSVSDTLEKSMKNSVDNFNQHLKEGLELIHAERETIQKDFLGQQAKITQHCLDAVSDLSRATLKEVEDIHSHYENSFGKTDESIKATFKSLEDQYQNTLEKLSNELSHTTDSLQTLTHTLNQAEAPFKNFEKMGQRVEANTNLLSERLQALSQQVVASQDKTKAFNEEYEKLTQKLSEASIKVKTPSKFPWNIFKK